MSTKRTKVERYFIAKDPAIATKTVIEYISKRKENDTVKRFYNKLVKDGYGEDIVKAPFKVYAHKNDFGFVIPEDGEYYMVSFIDYVENPFYAPTYTMNLNK